MSPKQVVIAGAFDRLQGREIRFLEECARLGELTVLMWPDQLAGQLEGKAPKFPEAERRYCLEAFRFVKSVQVVGRQKSVDELPDELGFKPDIWAVKMPEHSPAKEKICRDRGLEYRVVTEATLSKFSEATEKIIQPSAGRKKVVATGCFDWFHSGHARFCEEASRLGDLYVVVGSDANVRLLKGEGHPMFSQEQRRYVIGSLRRVKQAVVSTGSGWLDADLEIRRIQPDIFAVNEDGDKGGKREYCEKLGIEYVVLKRAPAPGMTARSSTELRGF
jgi:cytidyltransferase-like protein